MGVDGVLRDTENAWKKGVRDNRHTALFLPAFGRKE